MTALTHPPASRARRWFAARTPARGTAGTDGVRPRWERPAYWSLLAVTAVLLLWGLGASGYANSFYSAAAQAGSQSWKAFLFGSLDSGNSITVDKPPAALWPMALSVRLFGLGGWQILAPQALMGVGTVAVLYASVRRWFGPAAGLLAGGLLATTPIAALMFRFNNPDALLCLLTVSAVCFLLRAVEDGDRSRWLLLCGGCLGFGFLVKTLQAWLIVPALAAVYLACARSSLPRRIGRLLLAGAAMVAACGWWIALAELWPAASRPYIGGSQHNSFLELTFGYNGLGRITGDETGSVGGGGGRGGGPGGAGPGGGGGGMWGESGIGRMFGSGSGGQISWLLPAALILLVAGLVVTRRAARTDAQRAAFLAWGGSLVLTGVVFSLMSGIFHDYYTVALAPCLAAVVAMGAVLLWRNRGHRAAAVVLAGVVAATAVWSYVLLGRSAGWLPWLRWAVLGVGVLAVLGLLVARALPRRLALTAAAFGLAASVAGPVAYTLSTVHTPHAGSIVTAGPAVARGGPGGGPGFPGRGAGGPAAWQGRGEQGQQGTGPGRQAGGRGPQQGLPGRAGHGFPPGAPGMPGKAGRPAGKQPQRGGPAGEFTGRMRGGGAMGGLLNGQQVGKKAEAMLEKNAGDYTWAAAAIGSQNAASYQLATERPVMAIGGFNGTDPSPTLARFKKYVQEGEIHYFVGGSRGGGPGGMGGGRGSSSAVTGWVEKHYAKVTVGDATFYDLTKEK